MMANREGRGLVGSPADLTTTEMVVRATLEHRVLRFTYKGRPREVEPHLVGTHEAGEPLLVAYQTGGESTSGELPGWRTFTTAEVESVEIGEAAFPGPRPGFNPASHRMVEIFARA
jgi:hypothetical protein